MKVVLTIIGMATLAAALTLLVARRRRAGEPAHRHPNGGGTILIWRSMWPYLRQHRRWLLVALGAMLGEVVTGLLSPWPLKFVVDSVIFQRLPTGGGAKRLRTTLDAHSVRLLVLISAVALLIALF